MDINTTLPIRPEIQHLGKLPNQNNAYFCIFALLQGLGLIQNFDAHRYYWLAGALIVLSQHIVGASSINTYFCWRDLFIREIENMKLCREEKVKNRTFCILIMI